MKYLKFAVLPLCLAVAALTGLPRTSSAAETTFPVVISKALDLRRLGLAIKGYTADSDQVKHFKRRCYYYGDGGYDISFSNDFLVKFKKRGFSRRSLCMALISQARFDPETGRRLPTYIVAQTAKLAEDGEMVEAGDVSDELPFDVPDCFKSALPYSDCRMNFDLMTGKRLSEKFAAKLRRFGAMIERDLGKSSTRNNFHYMEDDPDGPTDGEIMVGGGGNGFQYDGMPWPATFYDYSKEFSKGYGYALNAFGDAGPEPSAVAVKQALNPRRRATEASLRSLSEQSP